MPEERVTVSHGRVASKPFVEVSLVIWVADKFHPTLPKCLHEVPLFGWIVQICRLWLVLQDRLNFIHVVALGQDTTGKCIHLIFYLKIVTIEIC